MKLLGIDIWKLFGPKESPFPYSRVAHSEDIPAEAKILNELALGMPGTGKTSSIVRQNVDYLAEHPDVSFISIDGSEDYTDQFLRYVLSKPPAQRDALIKRIYYDEIGHPEFVLTLPPFHPDHEVPPEAEVQRTIQDFEALNPELISDTPVMGGVSVKQFGRELFRLLSVCLNEYGTPWQLTEAKHLLTDRKLLARVINDYGSLSSSAKWFLDRYRKMKADEAEKRILGLLAVLDDIEAPEIYPRVGYHRPSYTFAKLLREGGILLVNLHRVNTQDRTLALIVTQIISHLMQEVQKRTPNNPNDNRVIFSVDELPTVLGLSNIQDAIKKMGSYMRSRKLSSILIAQDVSQFPIELRPHIWNYGSVTIFKLRNSDSAYEAAQQMFPYIPNTVKAQSKSPNGQDIYEPDRGQYLQIANMIREMKHRECIQRRQISEKESEKYIQWVEKTKEATFTATDREVQELKDYLLRLHGFRVDEVIASIKRRINEPKKVEQEKPPTIN
jgi:hypothetical protein